jgi:hypothetical protein
MNNAKLNLWIDRIIKEEVRKSLISEATLNLDEDVDYIFKKGFSKFFDKLLAGEQPRKRNVMNFTDVEFITINSSELNTGEAKQAHAVNPVTIKCGLWFSKKVNGSYNPSTQEIYISVNSSALSALYKGYTATDIEPDNRESFRTETQTAHSVKSTIYHELSHWIRDSLKNRHIQKVLGKTDTAGSASKAAKIMTGGLPDVYMTNYEIDALIHSIKQFKRDIPQDEWDTLTFLDLIRKVPTINNVFNRLRSKWIDYYAAGMDKSKPSWARNWAKEFVKMLIKRMSRENLLGNNMRKMNYNNWRY